MLELRDRVSVLSNLCDYFQTHSAEPLLLHNQREEAAADAGATTIGIEIEVRFSSFFATLYNQFDLAKVGYDNLSEADKQAFGEQLTHWEPDLLQDLNELPALGVPQGKDRYWEFAHLPVYHPHTLSGEVDILRRVALIPVNQKHSLHITIGGLGFGYNAGMLLMIMEMLGYSSKARIMSGVNAGKATSWSRKGRAGLRARTEGLLYGQVQAIELRTLELPTDPADVRTMLYVAWFLAETIRRPDMRPSWWQVVTVAVEIANKHGIVTATNWGPGYENVDRWTHLADTIETIDNRPLWQVVKEVINYQDKLDPENQYLRDGIPW